MSNGKLRQATKTGKTRHFELTTKAREIIKAIRRDDLNPFVFVGRQGRAYSWKMLTLLWRKACKQTGISINLYNGIRHSLGGQLMDAGVELEMVRDILGHTNSNMTRRYCHRSSAVMTRVLEFRGRLEDEKRPCQNIDKAVI
jgi:integrase